MRKPIVLLTLAVSLVSLQVAAQSPGRKMRRQHFDCHGPIQPRIARPIDFAHAAGAERGDDFVWAEPSAAR